MRHQCAASVRDREVALVALHRRDEHRVRKIEEFGVEVAGDRDRPFHESGVLLEERRVDAGPPVELVRRALDLFADDVHAFLEPGHHVSFASQRRRVLAGVPENDVSGVVETVPAGGASGGNSQNLGLDDLRAVHQHHPVRGSRTGITNPPPYRRGPGVLASARSHIPDSSEARARAGFVT